MRLICISLLLANALYFGYGQFFAKPLAVTLAVSTMSGLEGDALDDIVLLSEVSREALRELQRGGEKAQAAELATSGLSADLAKVAVADLVAHPILVERPAAGAKAADEVGVIDLPLVAADAVTDGLCIAIGPFGDLFRGREVNERLLAVGYGSKLKALDIESDDKDYRVMFPPAKSAANAFRRLRELKSQNIDSYVITKGKDAMAISLGVFSTKEAATKLQRKIEKQGYRPVLAEIKKYQRRYWIYGSELLDLPGNESLWASIITVSPLLSVKRRPCPD